MCFHVSKYELNSLNFNSTPSHCDCKNSQGGVVFHSDYRLVGESLCFFLVGDKQSPSVLCRADAEAAVLVQVFDVRSKEERLGV